MHHFAEENYNFVYRFTYNLHQQRSDEQCNFVIFFYYRVFTNTEDLYKIHFNAAF